MKLCNKFLGGIQQYNGELQFTNDALTERVKAYLDMCPHLLYRGDIVYHSGFGKSRPMGYLTQEKVPFGEVITNALLCHDLHIDVDRECTYNIGKREAATKDRRKEFDTFDKQKEYCGNSETKLMHVLAMQGGVGGYEVIDYQVPTTNGSTDKIDIVLKKDNIVYITEAKRFNSAESLVRCVLEIETYYRKLNERFFTIYQCARSSLKKAVLFDENSFAYRQLDTEWAKKLIAKFDITVLILSKTENAYQIDDFSQTTDGEKR